MFSAHFIWSTYGSWMPSAPRGEWSKFVAAWEQARLLAASNHEESSVDDPYRVQRELAQRARSYPAVRLDAFQIKAVSEGIERCIRGRRVWIWAAAILPDHVQLVLTSRAEKPELLSNQLRGEATRRLNELDLHPLRGFLDSSSMHPMMWSHSKWQAPLADDDTIRRAIQYVQKLSQAEQTVPLVPSANYLKTFQCLRLCREEAEQYTV